MKNQIINLKEFTVHGINYLGWKLRTEFEIPLGGEINFDKSFLHFNVIKIYAKVTLSHFHNSQWILDTGLNKWITDNYNNANSYFHIAIFK